MIHKEYSDLNETDFGYKFAILRQAAFLVSELVIVLTIGVWVPEMSLL